MNSISKIIINIDFEIEIHWEFDDEQDFAHQNDQYLNIRNADEIIFNDDDVEHFFCKKLRYFTCEKLLYSRIFVAQFNNDIHQNINDCKKL